MPKKKPGGRHTRPGFSACRTAIGNLHMPHSGNAINATPRSSWRDRLKVHPAADWFPLLPPDELQALGEDIKASGLRVPIVLWQEMPRSDLYLLDGRNRLDAMEATGQEITFDIAG